MRISIALCTYNSEKYIADQIQSLLNQTRLPDEIVISDDGSTDQTLKIIRSFSKNSKVKITIIESPGHLGVYKNFPYVMSHCVGDIIFPCDHDDIWLSTKLEKHMAIHTRFPNIDLVYSNADVVYLTPENYLYPLWEIKSMLDPVQGQSSLSSLLYKGRSIAGCCMSFKKELYLSILPFPDEIYHDDWLATSAVISGVIYAIPESLIKYRQHGNNAVGIIRGNKLSYYKSLFTNVKFYYESDVYIASRHEKIFDAIKKHAYLSLCIASDNLDACLSLYQTRTTYMQKSYFKSLFDLTQQLMSGHYQYLNGFYTYLKDLYNLMIVKLFVKN